MNQRGFQTVLERKIILATFRLELGLISTPCSLGGE